MRPPFFYFEREMKGKFKHIIYLLLSAAIIAFSSCHREEDYLHDAALSFSIDTLTFDTVFTTIGSTTRYFTVINNNSKAVYLNKIYLAAGGSSQFRLNIDGVAASSVSDVVIPANDSIFIFVEVTVDPTNSNSPMVVEDSVVFVAENSSKSVKLIAWGQDVHLLENYVLSHDTVWNDDKPYLIYVGDSETDEKTAVNAAMPFALFEVGYRKTPVNEMQHDLLFTDFTALTAYVTQ
jgi:hypothetical protein